MSAPTPSTSMKLSRAATATVAATPDGRTLTSATNADSRTPIPPGIGTSTKPMIHDSTAAGAMSIHATCPSNARATHHVAVPTRSQVGR